MSYEWDSAPADLPARLRAARAYAGISQLDMAERLNVTRASIRNWELGKLPKGHPLLGVLESYVEHTGIDRRWFEAAQLDIGEFIARGRPAKPEAVARKAQQAKRAIRQGKSQAGAGRRPRKAGD